MWRHGVCHVLTLAATFPGLPLHSNGQCKMPLVAWPLSSPALTLLDQLCGQLPLGRRQPSHITPARGNFHPILLCPTRPSSSLFN